MTCSICGKGFSEGGAVQETEDHQQGVCPPCLDDIYPGRSDQPVCMDGDGNLYFIEGEQQRVIIVFKYGPVPYSSRTEVDASEEVMDCEGFFLMGQ